MSGAADSAFVFYNETGGTYGCEPGVEPWPQDIPFNYGGQATDYHPDETSVTPILPVWLRVNMSAPENARPTWTGQ